MALSDDDKKEMMELFSDAIALGHSKYQSKLEEEAAKKPPVTPPKTEGGKKDDGFSIAGYLLGER